MIRYFPVFSPFLVLLAATTGSLAEMLEPEVDSIHVSGSILIPVDELLDGTGLEPGASLLSITPIQVRDGILANMRARGYLDAEVDVQWPLWTDEINVVRIKVEPGDKSLLSGLVFDGVTVFDADTLASLYPGAPGEPITPGDTAAFKNAVIRLYGEAGYIYADVAVKLGELDSRGDGTGFRAVVCSVRENVRAFLGSLDVEGLQTVRRKVVTRELLVQPGDVMNMELLRRSISNVYGLGLFRDVRFEYSPRPGDSTVVDLKMFVSEKSYRRVDFVSGYMSPSAVFGSVTWMHPNIMGNNQRLSIGLYAMEYVGSREGRQFEPQVVYEEPWLFSSRWKWQLKLGYLFFRTPGVRQKSYSLTSTFARDLSEKLHFSTGYSLEYEKYNEWTGSGFTSFDWRTTSSVVASMVHDTRGPLLDPESGHWLMGSVKLSGGILGGNDYYRLRAESRLFFSPGDGLVLAGRIGCGGAFPYGDDIAVPPDDRFFLGGGTSVRGYPFNSLGPEDDEGNPIGGRVQVLGNFEIRTRIVGNFGVVLFTDAGGVWKYLDEVDLDSAGFGTGVGLRYHTVFGPFRLDYGFAPTWRNSLRRGRIYVGLGHVF